MRAILRLHRTARGGGGRHMGQHRWTHSTLTSLFSFLMKLAAEMRWSVQLGLPLTGMQLKLRVPFTDVVASV